MQGCTAIEQWLITAADDLEGCVPVHQQLHKEGCWFLLLQSVKKRTHAPEMSNELSKVDFGEESAECIQGWSICLLQQQQSAK